MSLTALAQFVNALAESGQAIVTESSAPAVTIDGLTEANALAVADLVAGAGYACKVLDATPQAYEIEDLALGVEPYRIVFRKPEYPDTAGFISIDAFAKWCGAGMPAMQVLVGCAADEGFVTEAFSVNSWDSPGSPRQSAPRKQPTKLVRDSSTLALVPADVRRFLLSDVETTSSTSTFFLSWRQVATEQLVYCVASEVTASEVEFLGPPRLKFPLAHASQAAKSASTSFRILQDAVTWIYDSEREAELRHRLFAQELARIAYNQCQTLEEAISLHAQHALEGARIAYSFSVQDLARDSLKSLSELRKAVVEETQKLVETARQVALAGAGALFYALGLFAARTLAAEIDTSLLQLMAFVGLAYVWVILFANYRQVSQQAALRQHWKTKLYRYLSEAEYRELVGQPTGAAERFLRIEIWVVFLVATAVFGLAIAYFGSHST